MDAVEKSSKEAARARARAIAAIGRQIGGRYKIERLLGSGGAGVVYEAVHELTDRRVALKLMHKVGEPADSPGVKRFLREAKFASAIQHPGIVVLRERPEVLTLE